MAIASRLFDVVPSNLLRWSDTALETNFPSTEGTIDETITIFLQHILCASFSSTHGEPNSIVEVLCAYTYITTLQLLSRSIYILVGFHKSQWQPLKNCWYTLFECMLGMDEERQRTRCVPAQNESIGNRRIAETKNKIKTTYRAIDTKNWIRWEKERASEREREISQAGSILLECLRSIPMEFDLSWEIIWYFSGMALPYVL